MDIGDSLDNFKLVEILGKGGQGVVYKALDTKLERFVAIKVFAPGVAIATEQKTTIFT